MPHEERLRRWVRFRAIPCKLVERRTVTLAGRQSRTVLPAALNQARLQFLALKYNLANFSRRLAVPKRVSYWTLTILREKLIKIGAKATRHSKYVTFQLAEVAVPQALFAAILERIKRLAMPPPSVAGAYA